MKALTGRRHCHARHSGSSRRQLRLAAGHADLASLGVNQLQTRLHTALQAEVRGPALPGPASCTTMIQVWMMDLGQLCALLVLTVATLQDYATAVDVRDRLSALGVPLAQLSWRQHGLLGWLSQRAEQLGFTFPTGLALMAR